MQRRGGIDLLRSALGAAGLALACALVLVPGQARGQCATNGTNQTCTNPAGTTVSGGGGNGIFDFATLTLTNFGTVTGINQGIFATTANVTNSGTITGGAAVGILATTANVTNSGTITGGAGGMNANTANVANSGTITGGLTGIVAITANVTNSGTISGGLLQGIRASTANVTNSGTIAGLIGIQATAPSTLVNSGAMTGTGGTAIDLSASHADTLTFLLGSRIQGAILLGSGDTVNVSGGAGASSLLAFTANGAFTANVSGGALFVATSQGIATLDATLFGLADKNLMDFTRGISGMLAALGGASATSGPLSSAFAPTDGGSMAARLDDVFASFSHISALAYANDQAMVFKAPTYVTADGRAVWARGFGGERTQDPDGVSLGAHTTFYGGAVGFDMVARPDLRLGLFAGGGQSRLSEDFNAGNTKTDTAFGGVYGRWSFASFGHASFLDFALHGGGSTNATSRTLTSNVAPFVQIATGSYDSSYVSPEFKYGINLPLAREYTLTPSFGLRYVAGFFGGYTEAGSAANLTVASRTIQDLEERGELQLTRATPVGPDLLLTSVHIGAIGLERMGDTTVNTVLLGAGLPFVTPGKNDVAGVLGGGGIEWRTRESVSIFGAAEAIGFSDQSTVWSARGGIRVAF